MFQIKLREHPAQGSGCRVSGVVEGVLGEATHAKFKVKTNKKNGHI